MNKRIAEFLSELCDENERLEKETTRRYEDLVAARIWRDAAERKIKELLKVIRKLKKEAK